MYLSEWSPKLPGRIWTSEGIGSIKHGKSRVVDRIINKNGSEYSVLDPEGKKEVLSGGYGTIRLNPQQNNDTFCSYLTATSLKNWFCDGGIPLVVDKSVYDKFQKFSRNNSAPEIEELKGVLSFGWDQPWVKSIPKAIGSELPEQLGEILSLAPFVPRVFIHVKSQLNLNLKYNDSHPDCIAWTVFESSNPKRQPYSYTYSHFNPIEEESIIEAVDFINKYVGKYDGKKIITDFDGKEPKLNSILNLEDDPQNNKDMTNNFRKVYKNMWRTYSKNVPWLGE